MPETKLTISDLMRLQDLVAEVIVKSPADSQRDFDDTLYKKLHKMVKEIAKGEGK